MQNNKQGSESWKRGRALLLLVIFLLSFAGLASAQSNNGSLRGAVKDSSGAVVPGATVKITDIGTNATITLTSSELGEYLAPSLRPVTYDISAEMSGFKTTTIRGVKIDTARDSRVDITLEVGSINQTVSVTSEAPLLQAAGGAVNQTVEQKVIVDLPLNGRNTLELAFTLPGVSGAPGSELTDVYATDVVPGREININGGRPGSTQFLADGANITSIALARTTVSFSPDTIQEFSIQQSNYSAQYSQAGGAIINQTTKSGTNRIRGTAYWFHRQKALRANPFNTTRDPIFNYDARSPLRRQQLGATVGGPVWIPKLYNGRNKTFFFVSYEPTRQLTSTIGPSRVRVPTDLEKKGDFSQSLVYFANGTTQPYALLYNQFIRASNGALLFRPNPAYTASQPVSANNPMWQYSNFTLFNPNDPDPKRRGRVLVDANGQSYVNPVVSKIMNDLYPAANIPFITSGSDAGANFVYFRKSQTKDDRYTIRLDHRLNDKHTVYGRYTYQPLYGDRFNRDPIQNGGISEVTRSRNISLNWTGTLRSNMVNELRLAYVFGDLSRNFNSELLTLNQTDQYLKMGGPGDGVPNKLGYGAARFFGGAAPNSESNQTSGRSFDQLGFAQPQDVGRNKEHTYQVLDDFSWIRGTHSIRTGLAWRWLQLNQGTLGYGGLAGGRFNFGREQTGDRYCTAAPFAGSIAGCSGTVLGGDVFATFLLGIPNWDQVQTENLSNPYYYRWFSLGAYVQDDWRLRPNLTLNIGLRYQYQSPRWETRNFQGEINLDRMEPNPFMLDASGKPLPAPVFEFSGLDGRSRYMVDPRKLDFEPRIGFAWTPDFGWNKNRKLVIRGGYGIAHATLMGNDREPTPNIGSQTFSGYRAISYTMGPNNNQSPTLASTCGLAICNNSQLTMQFGFNNPVLAGDPRFAAVPPSGTIRPGDQADPDFSGARQDPRYRATGFLGDPNFRTPTIQNYSLQVQYEIMRNTALTVGYQGSRGTHLMGSTYDINRRDPKVGDPSVKYPGMNSRYSNGAIWVVNPTNSASTYHAATLEVERRYIAGLQFRFNYTYSKSIDDSSGGISMPIPNNSFNNSYVSVPNSRPQNPYNSRAERAPSSWDSPHIFNLSALYELPVGRGRKFLNQGSWIDPFIGGWQITGIGRSRSGYPLSVFLGGTNSLDTGLAGGNLRPNLIPGVPLINPAWSPATANVEPYVNPRAFSWPEPGQYGNSGRNISFARLPRVNTFDGSLTKRFYPFKGETRSLEFRVELFNFFNHKVYDANGAGFSLTSGGAQNNLLVNGTTGVALPDVDKIYNRYDNLRASGVWDAIITKYKGTPVDTAIASLPGPGPGGVGCPATAAELVRGSGTASYRGSLSPACVAREISLGGSFYNLNQNVVQSRIFQFGLKIYF